MLRAAICLALALSASSAFGAAPAGAARARRMAADAYATILDHPFEGDLLERASSQLQQAERLNENEPLIWVGVAQLMLTGGFGSGDFFDARNYEEGTIDKAFSFASKAVKLDDSSAESHAMMAKLYIILRKMPRQSTSWWSRTNSIPMRSSHGSIRRSRTGTGQSAHVGDSAHRCRTARTFRLGSPTASLSS